MENLKQSYIESTYEIISVLGAKETCRIYLARNINTKAFVIKKLVPYNQISIYEQLSKFNHPNLAKIIGIYKLENECVVIEEFISGESLGIKIERDIKLEEKEAVGYAEQLCLVLQFLHKHNIIHRDVNPNNIIISTDGILKLIDFDIARIPDPDKQQDTTILGTAGYAAPEQFGFKQTDKRTDIYSMGILLNVMLTGEFPNTLMPDNILYRNLIISCISIDPQARYSNAKEVGRELHSICAGSIGNTGKKQTNRIPLPGFRTGKMWKRVVAVLGYILILLSTITAVTYNSNWRQAADNIIILIFLVYIPFLLLSNIGYFDRKILFFQSMSRKQSLFVRICLCFVSFVFCFIFILLFNLF
jgi:serine/threonine protein kinase